MHYATVRTSRTINNAIMQLNAAPDGTILYPTFWTVGPLATDGILALVFSSKSKLEDDREIEFTLTRLSDNEVIQNFTVTADQIPVTSEGEDDPIARWQFWNSHGSAQRPHLDLQSVRNQKVRLDIAASDTKIAHVSIIEMPLRRVESA